MDQRFLYLATTPLTSLLAAGHALAHPTSRHRLVLIADFLDAETWRRTYATWRRSPFESIEVVSGRATESRSSAGVGPLGRERVKRRLRRAVFARLAELDVGYRPTSVVVGNDRRPETQYALHLAEGRAPRPGTYLDDGLFSYLGDANHHELRRLVDFPFKRMVYGSWLVPADVPGTTPWIARSWLAAPEHACDVDPERERLALPRAWFASAAFAGLAAALRRSYGVTPGERFRGLLVLPHSRVLPPGPEEAERVREALSALTRGGGGWAVKHHPRELDSDPFGLAGRGARILPAGLAFEPLLPLLERGAIVAGDASTALFAASWWRPDLDVRELGLAKGSFAERSREFLAKQGIAPWHPRPATQRTIL